MSTLWRAFAKINLGLSVLDKRGDGYHNVRTILQTIDLHDEIYVSSSDHFQFISIEGPADESNLVVQAVKAFESETAIPVLLRLELKKQIPSGAGLGGGSADAAATLMGLNRWFGNPLPGERLQKLLADLGSDVPFFSVGGLAVALGRGDQLFPLPDQTAYWLVLVNPRLSVLTADAYSWLTPSNESNKIFCFCVRFVPPHGSAEPFGDCQPNDFERSLFRRFPELDEIRRKLSASGAFHAALTGSGSTLFGRFRTKEEAEEAVTTLSTDFAVRLVKPLGRSEYFRRLFEEKIDTLI